MTKTTTWKTVATTFLILVPRTEWTLMVAMTMPTRIFPLSPWATARLQALE